MSAPRSLRGVVEADLARLAPLLGTRRSWWLREALEAERRAGGGRPAPPPEPGPAVDLAIVGGGFTGLWTAWHAMEANPGIRVALLDADIVGGGASGRNGGFATGMWESIRTLERRFGTDGAVATALAAEGAPPAIAAWCEQHGVDAWVERGGTLLAETSAAQRGAFDGVARRLGELGFGDRIVPLDAAEVQRRGGSPMLGAGYLVPGDVSIQPARLARGLRRVLLERGAGIHEGTRVRGLLPGRPVVLEWQAGTRAGAVAADQVVLALNAWAAGWPGFGTRLVTWSSYVVATAPMPERLSAIGCTGGEAITDGRFTNHYWRTTRDGRIVFGGGGGRAGYGGRLGDWVTRDLGSVRLAVRGFRRLYPALRDVPLEDAWGGPIDIAPSHLPTFGTLSGGTVHFGHGYSGTGVGASYLGGRILAALAAGARDDPVLALPLVGAPERRFPPEPLRWLGARVIREAIVAKEQRDDLGRPSPWPLRALVRLPRWMGYELGPE